VALAATAAATAGPALIAGGVWAEAHLFVDGVTLAYVALLIELKRRSSERETKVRHLPAYPEVPKQALRAVGERTP
jgi:hypothetical protein